MNSFLAGFKDELVKTAGLGNFMHRLSKSKELRHAIRRSALLGAGTGAIGGALQHKNPDESRLKKILGAALLGGAGGAVTGAAFPGWFHYHSMRAADEF